MKRHYAMRQFGLILFVTGTVLMTVLSLVYSSPGSFNQSFYTPEYPLRGFVIAMTIFTLTITGFTLLLVSFAEKRPPQQDDEAK